MILVPSPNVHTLKADVQPLLPPMLYTHPRGGTTNLTLIVFVHYFLFQSFSCFARTHRGLSHFHCGGCSLVVLREERKSDPGLEVNRQINSLRSGHLAIWRVRETE